MDVVVPSSKPDPKKDPTLTLTLTQRFAALDLKLEAKHAEHEAQAEETTRVVDGLKKCASRTRMSFQVLTEEELEDNGNGVLPPTAPIDPQGLAEALGQDMPTTEDLGVE